MASVQRARILSAMVEVAAERGPLGASVSLVVSRSGVSRRTFYELFEGREDCFLAALEDAIERTAAFVLPAYRSEDQWKAKMRAGLSALLDFCEREPSIARLLFVDSLGGGPPAQVRRRATIDQLVAAIDEGRGAGTHGDGPPALNAEGIVGAIMAVIHARLLERTARGGLLELVNPLMSMTVLPYLGRAAAGKELQRRLTPAASAESNASSNLLRNLGMRLTYRTMCVLEALEQWPKGSNRRIAESAGISDQGQISRLLARLEGHGLVENLGIEADLGAPNAWVLTEKGRELQSTIKQQLTSA